QTNLVTGDLVYYFPATGSTGVGGLIPGKQYVVNVIDPVTGLILIGTGPDPNQNRLTSARVIKLADPTLTARDTVTVDAGLVGTNGSNQGVVNKANNFQNNDLVTYVAPPAQTFSSLVVNLQTENGGAKPKVDSNNNLLYDNSNSVWLGSGTPDSNGNYPTGHGFPNGQAVIYRAKKPDGSPGTTIAPGVISDGQILFVHVLDNYRIQLADSFCHAVGCAAGPGNNPPAIPQQFITLAPDTSSPGRQVVHTFVNANDAPLTGLVPGQVYYVRTPTSGSFQLSTSFNGAPITFGNGGHTGGPHSFQVQGVDLTTAGFGQQNLVMDIHPTSGTQRLLGVGGSATLALAPTGD